jgi:polyphosphate kinase 2 (PPK2 family)
LAGSELKTGKILSQYQERENFMKQYMVKPKSTVNLSKWDPNDTGDFKGGKKEGQAEVRKLHAKLESLQELLFAEHWHKVLVVFQAMDTGGKDGTIRRVFDGVNPAGVRVASFKAPTSEELEHDFLWRIHKEAPGSGEMVILTGVTMRMCWSCVCMTLSRRKSGAGASIRSTSLSAC